MAEFKLVVNDPQTGKSYQCAVDDATLVGRKIGETVTGEFVGLDGYELVIRGGSDFAGFPMRKDIEGPVRKRALLGSGPGVTITRKGMRKRKTVCGNTITAKTVQVNLAVTKYGGIALEEVLGKKDVAPSV